MVIDVLSNILIFSKSVSTSLKALGASAMLGAAAANAEIDYAGVGYLGGSVTIDVPRQISLNFGL